jgi:hypothetical protein
MVSAEEAVGRVASVTGSTVVVLLEEPVDPESRSLPSIGKGTLAKIRKDRVCVFGLVTSLSIPMPARDDSGSEMRFAELALLGEIEKGASGDGRDAFQRGVSIFPTVGDKVFAATPEDLSIVYARPASTAVRIGTIHQDRSIPAYVSPDSLLGKHFAILGTTGTGKSCATALILRRIVEACPAAHIILLDPHNEYASAFPEWAEIIDSATLDLPYWLFTFEEFSATLLRDEASDGPDRPDRAILAELVLRAKRSMSANGARASRISLDTPVPYQISDLLQLLHAEMGRLNKTDSSAPYLRLKARIEAQRDDPRYRFMYGGITVRDTMASILGRLFRIPVNGKPISIIDLSAIPSEIVNIVVSVLSRITFDFALLTEQPVPILLVCEEAHRYIPADTKAGFEPTKRVLARIAKEGRKYGLSLGIISQRPSDLSISALSQCNTVFALRLTNQADQSFISGIMPDWGDGLLDFLSSLRNAEAVVVGEGMPVAARVRFDMLPPDQMPRTLASSFSTSWRADRVDADLVGAVVERWRGR